MDTIFFKQVWIYSFAIAILKNNVVKGYAVI